jgi:GNAT superfamily N-acetyltransferase
MLREDVVITKATEDDLEAIRDAHMDSIQTLGHIGYSDDIVAVWGRERSVDGYLHAMKEDGETYFIAKESIDDPIVLGFSSHRFFENKHRLYALYVRGQASGYGLGKKLLGVVENFARAQGAKELYLEGSLSAENFYLSQGFNQISRAVRLMQDVTMEVVYMKKDL